MKRNGVKTWLAAAAACVCIAGSASAATVSKELDFDSAFTQTSGYYSEDGLQFDDISIVSGFCGGVANPCGELFGAEQSILSRVGGGTFTLTSFFFELIGLAQTAENALFISTDLGGYLELTALDYTPGLGHTVDLTGITGFADASYLHFYTLQGGKARIDDFKAVVAAVPLPAAGWMLIAGLGGLIAVSRRKTAAV